MAAREHQLSPETALDQKGRWLLAFSYFGQLYGAAVFLLHGVLIFNVYYGASAVELGLIGTVMSFYNALNGLPIARLADAGWLNRFKCFPEKKCGRRGPWVALGVPSLAIGTACCFIAPAKDSTSLMLWFLFVYFMISNGFTAAFQSTLGILQETMYTVKARATQTMLGVPFQLVAYVLAGLIVPAILFTSVPSGISTCCVQPLAKCITAECPCYEGNETIVRLTSEYSEKCPRFVATELGRSAVCNISAEMASDRYFLVGVASFIICTTALVAIEPAKAPMTKKTSEPLFFLASIRETWKSRSFRWLAFMNFFNALAGQMLTGFMAYFFIYVIGIDFVDVGGEIASVGAIGITVSMLVNPFWNRLLVQTIPRSNLPLHHPAKIGVICAIADGVVGTVCTFLSVATSSVVPFTVYFVFEGFFRGSNDQVYHGMMGWIIDEDEMATGLRREGMFYAMNGACQHMSILVYYIFVGVLGGVGFDSSVCPQNQKTGIVEYIILCILFSRVTRIIAAIGYYMFPIKGEALSKILVFKTATTTSNKDELTEKVEME
jgi:Na+/melibiose symporter-like transporter